MLGLTVTCSPTWKRVTSLPSTSTVPTSSCPGISGNTALKSPLWMCRSVPQTPTWVTLMRTSPGPASGLAISLTAYRLGAS